MIKRCCVRNATRRSPLLASLFGTCATDTLMRNHIAAPSAAMHRWSWASWDVTSAHTQVCIEWELFTVQVCIHMQLYIGVFTPAHMRVWIHKCIFSHVLTNQRVFRAHIRCDVQQVTSAVGIRRSIWTLSTSCLSSNSQVPRQRVENGW